MALQVKNNLFSRFDLAFISQCLVKHIYKIINRSKHRILKAFLATSIGSVWRSYMGCRHDQHSSGTHWFFRVLQRSTANPGLPIFSLLFTFSLQKTHTKKIKHITRVGFPQFGKFTTLYHISHIVRSGTIGTKLVIIVIVGSKFVIFRVNHVVVA